VLAGNNGTNDIWNVSPRPLVGGFFLAPGAAADIGGNLGSFFVGPTHSPMPSGLPLGGILVATPREPLQAVLGLGVLVWPLGCGPCRLGCAFPKGSKGKGWPGLVAGTRLLVQIFTIRRGLGPGVGRAFHQALSECCEL